MCAQAQFQWSVQMRMPIQGLLCFALQPQLFCRALVHDNECEDNCMHILHVNMLVQGLLCFALQPQLFGRALMHDEEREINYMHTVHVRKKCR